MDYSTVSSMFRMDIFPDMRTREEAPLSVRGDAHHSWTIYSVNIDGEMQVVARSANADDAKPVMIEDDLSRFRALMVILHCHGEEYFERATLYASPIEWYEQMCSQY